MTRVSNTSGGAAAAGGFSFQANLGAIAYIHMLRGTPVQWTDGLTGAAPCAVSFETSGPGDDLSLELPDGSIVEIQAKKGLRADTRFWSALDALCEGIHCGRCNYGILIVCPNSSAPVREGYARALGRIGDGRNDGASPEQRKLANRLAERGYDAETVCTRIRIRMVSAFENAGDAIAAARAELGHVCADDRQMTSAWDALRQDALLAISTRGRRTLCNLSERLRASGFDIENIVKDPCVAVWKATKRYMVVAEQRLIRRPPVPRAAAQTLLSRLGETATDSVVTGKAGSGKTACVVEVTEALRKRGLPVLTFCLDRIQLLSASTPTILGSRLDLEKSPVLMLAAAAEAADRPGVLIVDQLDAVSTMSGRNFGAFYVVKELLQEARGTRARAVIHTVVVCRAFDWQHDHRLQQLLPSGSDTQVKVTEFTVDEVKPLLTDAGFDPALFREHQLALLRLPQNLSLFLEAGFDTSTTPAFGTATELFERYWTKKRDAVAERAAPSPDQWMGVMETLCDAMTSAQQPSAPRETLDKISPDYVKQLASEGVLTIDDDRRYGFGHESFFDYCFARVFVGRRESLVSFLKGSEQHLSRRAQVRQVLTYLRDADRDRYRYVEELRTLLSDEGIRAHIKDLAFALLAEVTDPAKEEWAILQQWIAPALKAIEEGTPNPDKLSEIAWSRFFGSPSWFAITYRRRVIENWLASGNDRLNDMAVNYLERHQRHSTDRTDRVAALLEPYADHGGEWALRLRSLMEWADLHTSRCFFDLFLRLVDNGTLDEAWGPNTFWSNLRALVKNRPEWIPEVMAHRFRRRLAVVRASGSDLRTRAFFGYEQSAAVTFNTCAKHAPEEFVEHVLPVVLEISDSALIGDTPPKRDAVWRTLIKTDHPSGESACLSGLDGALAALARDDTADLRDVILDLRRRDTHVANHLLLALYTAGAARHADEAAALLCDEPWRFQCGFSDSPHWCAMEAIRAVAPRCTAENRERLEMVILGYVHPYERTKSGFKRIGWARFALLSAIPPELRSAHANAHFKELERKFPEPQGEPRGPAGGPVKSPIKKDAADKMTDDQWLRAIKEYHSEEWGRFLRDEVTGGARQLAQQVLEECAKEEPERFARLSLRFPADTNPVYLEHTLSALKKTPIASDLKLQVCRKAFAESFGPCGRSIADVLGNIEDPLPDDAVQMLHRLATEHEDPDREAWQEDAGSGKPDYGGDIYTNGIYTTRGRAADAIRVLILSDATYIDRFRPTLGLMVRDRSAAVLSCVTGTLGAVACHDPALGISLFRNMDLSEDRLLATPHVYGFIHDHLRDGFAELRPIVEHMLRSSEPEVREDGAYFACIASLIHEGAADLVDEALRGDARHRLGVAQVAAAYIAAPEYRAWCEATLAELFDDDDSEVRRKAASCFRRLQDEALDTYGDLIATFCDSKAFQEGSFSILHTLEKSQGRLPGMTCEVCDKFLDRFADEAQDIRTRRAGDTRTVAELVFRTYQQHQDDEWTVRSLDLIDRLCLDRIHEAGCEFEQLEAGLNRPGNPGDSTR